MITVGIDLAAEPAKTGLAMIEWSQRSASLLRLDVGVDDDQVVAAARDVSKVGVDCPLGWPDSFVAFLVAAREGRWESFVDGFDRRSRRALAYRLTDEHVRRATGLVPLSVSADRIAHTAMRCAGILSRLALDGVPVDRSGSGLIVEVYPAAALKLWGLPHRSYKGANRDALNALVNRLLSGAPWLDLGPHEDKCRRSDDALDALLAAIMARAAVTGRVQPPPVEHLAQVRREGWIALPTGDLRSVL